MNIEKALEHFEWKFKNHWRPTEKDIEAFNSIIEYKEIQQSKNMFENENLAKLWIHQLMLLNKTKMYSAERSIQVIDEILDKSVYEWCIILKENINLMRFNTLLKEIDSDVSNKKDSSLEVFKTIDNIRDEKQKEMIKALYSEVSEENIIKFVEKHINRIINKYEK